VPDAEFMDTYRRFVTGWSMEDVPQVATVPLNNLVAECDFKLTPFFQLVPFTPADKNLLFSRSAIFGGAREPDYGAKFKLSGRFSNDTRKSVHFGTVAYETRLTITAMRLLKQGDVGARMMYYRSSLEHEEFTGGSGMGLQAREFTSAPYLLKADEGSSLLSLATLLHSAPRSLDVALRRFNQSYSRQSDEDRIIDLTIALESSLLADINEELKYRLALRGATVLKRERNPREVNALLLAMYDARSAIVHEGKLLHELEKFKSIGVYFTGFQPQNLPSLWEELTRQILRAYLAKGARGVTIKVFNKDLDSELVENIADTDSISRE
jgi:hypothetical protein